MFENIEVRVMDENLLLLLEEAILNNTECSGNILLTKRVFLLESNGKTEILCSLNNKTRKPHYWGHVFFKEGHYLVTILAIDRWLNPRNISDLFEQFWYEIEINGNWYPIGGEVFAVSTTLSGAVENLKNLISNFSEKAAINTTNHCDYRVAQVYPFPDPFKEKISLKEWQERRSLNAER